MSQYVAFEKGIQTNAIAPFLESGFIGQKQRREILENNNIGELNPENFYDLQNLLNAFRDLEKAVGEMNLFLIGKSVTEKVEFPPMDNLKQALESIDIAYHMSHRKRGKPMFDPSTGKMIEGIGNYKLVKFDKASRTAIMECHTPYPSKFEEGLLVHVLRTFRPSDSIRTEVTLDETKETRRSGGDRCTFILEW